MFWRLGVSKAVDTSKSKLEINKQLNLSGFCESFQNSYKISSLRKAHLKDNFSNGLLITLQVMKEFVGFKETFEGKSLSDILTQSNVLLFNQCQEVGGINALNIFFDTQVRWDKSFEDFLISKELKIITWKNPIEQIYLCIILSNIYKCYFDLSHHLKAAASILSVNANSLETQRITNQISIPLHLKFYDHVRNAKKYFSIKVNKECIEYTPVKCRYPFIKNFITKLPGMNPSLIFMAVDIFSSQSKQSIKARFKRKRTFSYQLMVLLFQDHEIPDVIYASFNNFYQKFKDKELVITEINVTYQEFRHAMNNFEHLHLRLNKNIFMPGLVEELIQNASDSKQYGPILTKGMGMIPKEKILIPQEQKWEGLICKQVLSVYELRELGLSMRNCLANNLSYESALVESSDKYFFVFMNSVKSRSFCCYLSIVKGQVKINEMKRPNNRRCEQSDLHVLYRFLLSEELIELPCEIIHCLLGTLLMNAKGKKMNILSSKKTNLKNGTSYIKNNAEIITKLIQELPSKPLARMSGFPQSYKLKAYEYDQYMRYFTSAKIAA